jgi:hypothetical protein
MIAKSARWQLLSGIPKSKIVVLIESGNYVRFSSCLLMHNMEVTEMFSLVIYINTGPALAGISAQSNNPSVVHQGVFATASFATFKMRKEVELWEICFTMLQKVPKAYNKVTAVEFGNNAIVLRHFHL